MIRSIRFERFKSMERQKLDLGALTILIGPNAAGKSNVLDGFRLMSEAVRADMETAVTRRGGIDSLVFKGSTSQSFVIELEYFVPDPGAPNSRSDMHYRVEVGGHKGKPAVLSEKLQVKQRRGKAGAPATWVAARLGKGTAIRDPERKTPEVFNTADPGVLALKALGFLTAYPRIRALRTFVESWQFLGVNLEAVRAPRRDERAETLLTDASNLANVLRTLQGTSTLDGILTDLRDLLAVVDDVRTQVDRGQVVLLLKERPFAYPWEAFSVSDGTLRLLCLITALHLLPEHGILCIEEPEHGLHPHLFGPLLDLIRERCPADGAKQVLLTTHSPDLVDAASGREVVTVERDDHGATLLQKLEAKKLAGWIKEYRLGELWRMRQIGGVPR